MEKDTNSGAEGSPAKSKIFLIIGYGFLMAMALFWSVDNSIVYIFFGIAVYFLFLSFYTRPRRRDFQEGFRAGAASTKFSDTMANIFQKTRPAPRPFAKSYAKSAPTPEQLQRRVGFVIAGIFIMFFIFFFGSIFFSSNESDPALNSFQTAEGYFMNGNYDSAYVNYRDAWKENDQYVEAMVGYGKVLAVRNQQDSAIIMFDKALAINPDYNDASYNKALAFYNRENYSECISLLTPVLERDPTYYDAMLLIGDAYYEQKQFDNAITWYSDAYGNGGIRSRALCHVMAYIYDTQGDYSRAIDLYKEALSYDSTVVDIYRRLGELLPNEDGNFYRTQAVKLRQN